MTRAALTTLGSAIVAFAAVPGVASAVTVSASTGSPQDVTATSATFRASVLLSVLGGSVTWDYGTTTAYGTTTPAVQTALVGAGEDVTIPVTGLTPNTRYHVRVTASALLATAQGKDVSFRTKKADGRSGDDDAGTTPVPPAAPAPPAAPTPPAPATPARTTGTTTSGTTRKDDNNASSPAPVIDDSTVADDGTDGGATAAPGVATATVTPVLGRTLAVATVAGTVTATAPAGAPVSLDSAQAIPTGTLIDARRGTVELKTALGAAGTTQTARFWGALFEVRQSATRHGLTQLTLRGADFGTCASASKASKKARASRATKKKPPARSLWGSDDHGRFETRGRGSVATVRGTRWLTTDTCAGTRTTVLKGAVAVKDLARGRTVVVTKGHSYLARTAP
jgi:hypothetical protein